MPPQAALIAELVDRHAAALVGYARQAGAKSPEDIVQEAFCRLVAQRRLPTQPPAWLYRVVRNLVHEQARAEARRQRRERDVAVPETVTQPVIEQAESREVMERLSRLAPELRETVLLRLWSDLSLAEIASVCGVSVATAHRRWQSALQQLQEQESPSWNPRPTTSTRH